MFSITPCKNKSFVSLAGFCTASQASCLLLYLITNLRIMKVLLWYNHVMSEITYNGITVYISDDVLIGVRRYIALNEVHPAGMAAHAAPQASMPQYAAPPMPSMAPAPKRRRGIFAGFTLHSKKDSAKPEKEESCEERAEEFFGSAVCSDQAAGPIDDILSNVEDTFQTHLLKLIDKKELTDSEVYKKAEIDRRHFSKIRSNPDYRPKKQTALALAFALELNMDEAVDLLSRAGYAFSPSSRADLIARYCIEHEIYDLTEVNALLFYYDQPLLGLQAE